MHAPLPLHFSPSSVYPSPHPLHLLTPHSPSFLLHLPHHGVPASPQPSQ
ncbi:hypothetical protein E2C01_068955 [Portunus trituberculatus]|uniref:Uncharacterized protein n=1 Tax=Portunus trituberculatus TaxID=210409 RepID=A0A5B7HY42_PORTR|nr:hypothetical protein [Portunus trituberculatus]